MNNICRNSIFLFFITAFIVFIFLLSCTSSEDSARTQRNINIKNEIASVEGQIRQIDQEIAQRTTSKSLFTQEPLLTGALDAKISQLKSEREMLMAKLNALQQSLYK